jgi:RND family efflux transporter MFP subunit
MDGATGRTCHYGTETVGCRKDGRQPVDDNIDRDIQMNRFKTLLVWAFAGLLLLTACEQQVEERAPVVRPVKIMTIGGPADGRKLTYAGEIRAGETADLGFEVPGRIVEFLVVEGQEVAKGDLLAKLDPADYQSQLDQAQAHFNQTESTYERYKEIVERGAVSRQELDLRKRNFEVARADLARAQKALNDTRLVAPFSGNIGRTLVDNFVNVQAKQPVLVLQDTSKLEVVITIPEQDWSRADPNLTNEQRTERVRPMVSLSSFPEREFPAQITELATVADPVTRTFEVRARLDNPEDVTIMPGMTANVSITVPEGGTSAGPDKAVVVPANAVVGDEQGNSTVWKVDPDTMTVSRVEVQLGELTGTNVRVLSGLGAGDRIATSGVHNLREGMQVSELRR